MELKQLNYFMVCARCGSFSAAAGQLYTTQSSVSKTIRALETELGVRLFERGARGIRLTEAGGKIYRQADRIEKNLQEILRICEDYRGRGSPG